jgi:hypothetical protein
MRWPTGRNWVIGKMVGLTVLGALGGYHYYVFVGCSSGTCPLTSSPISTTGLGAVMGLTIGWP